MTPLSGSHFKKNDNRMSMSSGCHFKIKWQPDGTPIRLSFQNKMTTGWHPIRLSFKKNSFYLEMTTGWHTHPVVILILKWQPDGAVIRFSFPNKNENRMEPIRFSYIKSENSSVRRRQRLNPKSTTLISNITY